MLLLSYDKSLDYHFMLQAKILAKCQKMEGNLSKSKKLLKYFFQIPGWNLGGKVNTIMFHI